VPFYIEFYERYGVPGGAAMHDPLALALAIDESLGTFERTRIEVETDGVWTRGMTVADLRGVRHSPWPVGWQREDNARVALDVDVEGFLRLFADRLRSLVERSA
jgi:inosine-uridine nucleoside N-ribohydrolase